MVEIVGRDEELACLRAFVGRTEEDPAALVLEGEAGIGKSTLWSATVAHARDRGLRVLSSRPAEAERGLAHAGLHDLFEDVLHEVLPALSTPRRRALETACLLRDAADEPLDTRALGVAVRDVLDLLGGRESILVAVDDVQWLDRSTSNAVAFALRRLCPGRVLVLLARRLDEAEHQSALEQALGKDNVQPLRVAPLSVGALHRVLRDRLRQPFPRQTLLSLHEHSGGNPFYALELARVLDTNASLLEPIPVPETLEGLVRARLSGLPRATRQALALASALGTPSEALLERAGVAANALEPALAAHVVEREHGSIRFTHPLLSSVLYQGLGAQRSSVHRRIAAIVDDPLVRVRHLALAQDRPDVLVARQLDEAATVASARGATAVAAELAEQALRVTPAADIGELRRRTLAAARGQHVAGEWTRARALLSELLAETTSGPERAEALLLLAELEGVDRAADLLEDALREAESLPALQSVIHCRLAWAGRFRRPTDHAALALRLAEQLGDELLVARARAVKAVLGWFTGDPTPPDDLALHLRHLPDAIGGERLVQEAMQAVVNTLAPASRRGEARAMLVDEHEAWRETDEPRSARALWGLAWVEFWAGHWQLAAAHADRAHDIAIQYGLEVPQDHLPIAVVAVHRGQLDLARLHSERALDLAQEQLGQHPPQHLAVLGLVALHRGNQSEGCERLTAADRQAAELGWREPSVRWWTGDLAELLLELGRTEEAAGMIEVWQADAERVGREWVLAQVTRCRGLARAAAGEPRNAAALLERAVIEHEQVGDPFGRARALLALGIARRRTRQKRPAREAIVAAVEEFEQLGAETWAEKARRELGSIGGRRRQEGLTAAERRVALLAAEGRTNREVAAALFLGERTVASHLTHVYAKLGVRSRTELARRLDPDESSESGKVQTF